MQGHRGDASHVKTRRSVGTHNGVGQRGGRLMAYCTRQRAGIGGTYVGNVRTTVSMTWECAQAGSKERFLRTWFGLPLAHGAGRRASLLTPGQGCRTFLPVAGAAFLFRQALPDQEVNLLGPLCTHLLYPGMESSIRLPRHGLLTEIMRSAGGSRQPHSARTTRSMRREPGRRRAAL